MDEATKEKATKIILAEWDNFKDKTELANKVMLGFIFGDYAKSEHYNIDEYWMIIQEIENPPKEEEITPG